MNICAVIAEYNPFHSGHEYHLRESRRLTGADCIAVVMSGSFTQRGEAAVFDKYIRAQCAAAAGADIVIELPFPFACASAEYFASGAVRLIKALGCVKYLSFGSESGNIKEIEEKYLLATEGNIKRYLSKGMSYAAAAAKAAETDFFTPNNILAAEYLKALKKYAPDILAVTVKRLGEGYSSAEISDSFISATACRRLLEERNFTVLQKYLPQKVFTILKNETDSGRFADISKLDGLYLGLLRRDKSEAMSNIAYIKEGLENRFASAAMNACSAKMLLGAVKTKRYTYTSLSRMLTCMAAGLTRAALTAFVEEGPKYANILAVNNTGREVIRNIKSRGDICVISKLSDSNKLGKVQKEIFDITQTADGIYGIALGEPTVKRRKITV